MATDMRLGGCAIGITNIDLFAKMTGIEFHVEGPVGQFAIGRGDKSGLPTDDRAAPAGQRLPKGNDATGNRNNREFSFTKSLGSSEGSRYALEMK